jgi:hypothetical protein
MEARDLRNSDQIAKNPHQRSEARDDHALEFEKHGRIAILET